MRGKTAGWILFLGVLLLLSFAATTRYSETADLTLIAFRFAIVLALSVLVIGERWRHRHDEPERRTRPEAGETLLQRFRRWYYDEQKHTG